MAGAFNLVQGEYLDIGSVFENNTAIYYGGSLYLSKFCKVSLQNTSFLNSQAYFKGGSIYA